MHETQEMMQGNAVNIQECMAKRENNSSTMVQKGWFSAETGSWFKCLLARSVSYQAKVTKLASKDLNTILEQHGST